MLQPRLFAAALRQTPLQRGVFNTTALTGLPRLLERPLARRTQRQNLSLLARRGTPPHRHVRAASWRNTKVLPFLRNTFRRYSSDDKPALSLSDRFKELSRKYGWAAVGVYLGLSALDFPFCFMAVRLVGPDRIGEVEHKIVDWFWRYVGMVMPSMRPQKREVVEDVVDDLREAKEDVAADAKKKEDASIWTQLLLAYGLHKSLMIFRIPLTAAVTPKIVKTLRKWGYNIGPRVKKPSAKD